MISSPTDYGSLNFRPQSGVTAGTTIFGIHGASAIASGSSSYAAVLSGLTSSNFASLTGLSSGNTFSNISWELINIGQGNVWDLKTTNNINTSPVVAGSNSGSKLAEKIGTRYKAVAPETTSGPTTTTTTSTTTVAPAPVPTTSIKIASVSTTTPTSASTPTKIVTTTYQVVTTPTGSTTTAPTVTTTTVPTITPSSVSTTTTAITTTKIDTPTSTIQPTVTTTTTAQSVTTTPIAPTLVNGSSLVVATQALTSNQVNQLINAHAEGYSSNMTILMERMAGVSNAVMGRIHGAGTGRTANMSADKAEKDQFMWAEVSGYRGFVDSYANLAGFGYNIADVMAGFDVYRGELGGLGVFAGGGTSRITESAQVRQNYNSTNGYAGLYGATFLPHELRLSGALGYMYSSTNAQRFVPSIGAFTGGTAQDVFTSNGAFGAIKLARPIATFGSLMITPFIGQTYSQLWVGRVNEVGGGDFNFSIDAAKAYSSISFVGVDFVLPLTEGKNEPLSLIGMARYGYDWFADTNAAHSVVATSPVYGAFTQIGANMGPNGFQLGGGLQGGLTDSISIRAGVVGQINTHGREIGAGGRIRVVF